MVVSILFIVLIVANLVLNIVKTYYDRKIEHLKAQDTVPTQKDVYQMHSLMSKEQTTSSNILLVSGACLVLTFSAVGVLRITCMILLVSSFFIAYGIDVVIQRRDSLRRIKQLERNLSQKNVNQ